MRLVASLVALIFVTAQMASADEAGKVMRDLLSCRIDAENSKDFGFYIKEGGNHKFTDVILSQAASSKGLPISPEFDITLRALDGEGRRLKLEGARATKHIKRLVVHEIEEGLAVSYAEAGGSVDSFLLTLGASGSFLNFHHKLSREGINYQTPQGVVCTVISEANILEKGEPVKLEGLNATQKVLVMKSFIGVRNYDSNWNQAWEKLGISEADWEKKERELGDAILKNREASKKYEGECKNVSAKVLTATDHSGQVLGYRLTARCIDLKRLEERINEKKTYRIITPFEQRLTVYLASDKKTELAREASEKKGYEKHVKIEGAPTDDED